MPFYRLFERYFDRYVAEYDERFEHREGPLRRVVTRVVGEYLECGRLHGGFARIRCPSCKSEHLLAFSCQTRNFCPSCQAKRGALFAELLVESVLEEVPHRHVVFCEERTDVLVAGQDGRSHVHAEAGVDPGQQGLVELLGHVRSRSILSR